MLLLCLPLTIYIMSSSTKITIVLLFHFSYFYNITLSVSIDRVYTSCYSCYHVVMCPWHRFLLIVVHWASWICDFTVLFIVFLRLQLQKLDCLLFSNSSLPSCFFLKNVFWVVPVHQPQASSII